MNQQKKKDPQCAFTQKQLTCWWFEKKIHWVRYRLAMSEKCVNFMSWTGNLKHKLFLWPVDKYHCWTVALNHLWRMLETFCFFWKRIDVSGRKNIFELLRERIPQIIFVTQKATFVDIISNTHTFRSLQLFC